MIDVTVSRTTERTISDVTLRGLQGSLTALQKLQNQLSTGRQIDVPSDDPSGTGQAMQLSAQKASDDQYLRNIGFATSRLGTTDTALQDLSSQLQSARNLLVQSRDASLNSDSMTAISQQVSQIRSDVIDLYNTRYLDRPVFGGTIPGQQAVDPTTGAYLGNNAPITTRISGDATVRLDVQGTAVGADTVPGVLATLATNISTTGATDADLTALDNALSQINQALGDVGSRDARVNTTQSLVTSHQGVLMQQISDKTDIDLPATITAVQTQQVAYQSALGAAAKLMQKSLVDFLT